jgi:hypothetical protein
VDEQIVADVRHSLRTRNSSTFEEEAAEIIGVILAGSIIGLLVAPRPAMRQLATQRPTDGPDGSLIS